jgi:hypothetical protein
MNVTEHQPAASQLFLTIIIVNWNTVDLLRDCLRTLAASELRAGCEVIVVDNHSHDGSPEMVRREFGAVRLIANQHNPGFAYANNQGIAASQSRYVLLLNSDTRMPAGTLAALLAFMEQTPRAGVCSPRLQHPDGRPQVFAFGNDPTPRYLLRRGLWRLVCGRSLHDWATPHTQKVDWVSGACMLVRRAAIEQAGMMDDAMFMYFEDSDWCLRIRQQGWQVYYYPRVAVIHLGGQSLAQNPAARTAYYHSLRAFYAKHYGWLARRWLSGALWLYRALAGLRPNRTTA